MPHSSFIRFQVCIVLVKRHWMTKIIFTFFILFSLLYYLVPCSQSPSCPVKGTQECKKSLARLVCQKMIKDNINPIPKACDSLWEYNKQWFYSWLLYLVPLIHLYITVIKSCDFCISYSWNISNTCYWCFYNRMIVFIYNL